MQTLKTLALAAFITLTLAFAGGQTAQAGEPFHPFWDPTSNTNNLDNDAYFYEFLYWYYGW